MSYQYRFCPSCGTQRAALDYRCQVCGGIVRHSTRSLATASPADPGVERPFSTGWRKLTAEDLKPAAQAARAC
jgi:hypothetical protein